MAEQEKLDLFNEESKYIKGRHLVTIFHNEQNLYTVLRIRVDDTNENYEDKEAVITGYFPRVHDEETYIFYGQMKDHPKFGLQFQAEHFRKELPQTKQGVIAYLSGELFKGIGKKTAENIVDTLGENAISKILTQPSLLDSVPKLPSEKAKELYDTLMENQGLEQAMIALNQYGFGPQISMKIYQAYKELTLDVIQSNPYQLVEDVEGIGFSRADELGFQIGISGNHPDRIKAGCLYVLENECQQAGHVYIPAEELLVSVKALLEDNKRDEIEFTDISNELVKLAEDKKIIIEDKRIYLPSYFYSEKGLVKNIRRVLQQKEYEDQFPESEFLLALGELEERLKVQYAPSQKEAIQTALMSPMLILTGGPGTGKTTVIKGIVELYSELHGCSLDPKDYKNDEPFPFLLAAPTGRAAKRMTESTGLPAVTIHRLLGWNGVEGFSRNEDDPLEGKILIVDETSMLDIWLAHQLFKAVPEHIQVILVGDEDQLPSVGPGQVLKDLLESERIPTVRLTDIYRQEEGSSIIDLAHSIKTGQLPDDILKPQRDRSFIRCGSAQIGEVVQKVAENAKKKGYTSKDIQVLAPMYKGPAGIDKLNEIVQQIFNANDDGSRKELKFGEVKYRIGDKVLQLVNQPENHIFNGDIGEIVSIFYAKENTEKEDMIIVSFDGIEATYTRGDLTQITHAFCTSVHKSQGSEFPIVILPVVKSYYRMLRRNLIYTAITRSKQSLILCGEEEALRMAVARADEQSRLTTLQDKLREAIEKTGEQSSMPAEENEESSLLYEETIMDIDPLIGMENVTPYDFMEKE
ncbi:SF1B family DNA helicase RecD2 [Robertmurraya kyonggiensis]|uniref:ATP-dependent RecD2 DNA helicase n=1 Tax=Robertmurraya kyonggiensis TaxID=1037680 RepID=A0A4U1DCV5_9BACI|nr:ATP-dependent RecD-like DNA helicase [Robertmurraya kyonggiensis]TKC20018.1 ATP-dependent RecD-like DNA helicase [Robertmurraya kyonggiensis]